MEMELQLGLSLVPSTTNNSSSSSSSTEGFDLNHFVYEAKSSILNIGLMSDQYGPTNFVGHIVSNNNNNMKKKRMFSQAFSENGNTNIDQVVPKTLPLLWNNNPPNTIGHGEEEDEDKNPSFSLIVNSIEEEEEEGVVGWPPIKSWRKRLCCGRSEIGNRTVENSCSCGERVSKFMYVKVKMEGVAIARKVDLSAHSCFETLMNTLMGMFGKCHEDLENFKLTYQDREGDWLLAHDVSWRTFIRSVQRLKLVRRNHSWNH